MRHSAQGAAPQQGSDGTPLPIRRGVCEASGQDEVNRLKTTRALSGNRTQAAVDSGRWKDGGCGTRGQAWLGRRPGRGAQGLRGHGPPPRHQTMSNGGRGHQTPGVKAPGDSTAGATTPGSF